MAKICNNCGAQIADDSQFCTLCGAKTADICKQCGKELKEGAKFCVGCGTLVEEPLPEAASTCPDAIICRQCGKELKEGAKFCVECGTLVEEPSPKSANSCANANVCRQCGKELKEGAKFCVGCGTLVEESSQGIITASENDQVSAPPDRPQQIIESVTDEITKPYNDFIDQAEAPSLASSQNIAETVLPPINPPLSPAATPPEAKKRFFSKKIYLGILGALAVACVFIYINVGIFVIPPSMITGGLSVVYWRNDTKNPFISSPEIMISEDNFYTKVALLKKISDREITRFKYNDWLYSKALKGIEFAGPSSPSAQATEPTEEPVALADEEGIEGMIETGNMYYQGKGVAQNFGEAFKWFKKAADLGNASAMKNLGWMYDDGDGVAQNYGEALKWFKKAADLGDADAMYKIGYMYYEGNGVAQNYGEALKWYKKAADLGKAEAMYDIGAMYEQGEGVTRNKSEAVRWYEKGAAQLEEDGCNPADVN